MGGPDSAAPLLPPPQSRHKLSPRWLQRSWGLLGSGEGGQQFSAHPHCSWSVEILPGSPRSILDRRWMGKGGRGGGGSGSPLQRMIWLVKLRLSSLCGRTIEFRMSTSAGIRTRQPAVWARAPRGGHGEGRSGQGAGGHHHQEGPLTAHLCPGLMPPAIHTGTGTQQALGKCLLKENTAACSHKFSP